MPTRIAAPPAICAGPSASWNATAPVSAPISGSRLTKAPATAAGTRACAHAKSENASAVPVSDSASTADDGAGAGRRGRGALEKTATGSAARPPAASWTAVTAAGSRPASRLGWTTMKAAEPVTESSTSRSPASEVPAPPPPATRPTPASATSEPAQASALLAPRRSSAEMMTTSTGTAPTMSAAWLTLVRSRPAFCSRITPP